MLATLRPRQFGFILAVLLGITFVGVASPPRAVAQDEANQDAGEKKPPDKNIEVKQPEQSVFVWFIVTSGFIGLFLLLLSIYFVSTIGRLFIELRPQIASPPEITDEVEDMLQKRQFKEIYGVVKDDQSFFSRVLSTGIAELPNGLAEARDSMERVGEVLTVELEKKISMLAVIGTLGPMIGLLGTLKGMIASFSVIARSGGALNPQEVAKGISEALLLTFEGVILSVPAIYFFALFRNRVQNLSVSTMLQCDEFLRHFAHAARSKGPAGGAPTPAAAAAAKAAGKP